MNPNPNPPNTPRPNLNSQLLFVEITDTHQPRPHDWDFQGTPEALEEECFLDAIEILYVAGRPAPIGHAYENHHADQYRVWRLLPGAETDAQLANLQKTK